MFSAILIAAVILPATSASTLRRILGIAQPEQTAKIRAASPQQSAGADLKRTLAHDSLTAFSDLKSPFIVAGGLRPFAPPPPVGETIETFAQDCTTPKSNFDLGEKVCVKVTGAPVGTNPVLRRIFWANTMPLVVRAVDVTSDPQTDIFTIPTAQTSIVAGQVVDNRGVWRVNDTDGIDGTVHGTAFFTVSDPQHRAADLVISNVVRSDTGTPSADSDVIFTVYVKNNGPDNAGTVTLTNIPPANVTFISATPGAGFTCTNPNVGSIGTSTCTAATFPVGSTASFTFDYHVNAGTPTGTELTDQASVSGTTADQDTDNNSSSASAFVNTASCPINLTQTDKTQNNDPGQGGAVVTYTEPTPQGSCPVITCSPASGAFFPIGTTVVTCNNEIGDFARFKVTINDTEPPHITCPSNVTAYESSPHSGSANVTYPDPTATDNGPVTVTTDHPSGSSFPVGTTTVTATATDGSGNTDTCTFTVTVNEADCVMSCPADITVAVDPATPGFATVNFGNPATSGTCGSPITYDHPSGSQFPLGTTTVTATSALGFTCTFRVTVSDTPDTEPPVITCPAPISEDAGQGCSVNLTPTPATATDNFGSVTVTGARSDGQPLNGAYPAGSVVITWTATDGAGNQSSCEQLVTVAEHVAPSVTPPANKSVAADDACSALIPDYTATIVASDNCTPRANLEITQSPGAETVVNAGPHVVTITVKDTSGNTTQVTTTFTVLDTTAPTLALNGNSTMTIECHTGFTDPGATASDACDGDLTSAIQVTGSVNPDSPGTYTLTYNVSDQAHNAAIPVSRTVTVVDTIAPVITLDGPNPMTVECHTSFTDPGATASDSCAGSFPATASGVVDVNTPGSYVVTYSAHDPSGNEATHVTRTVNVVDTIAPTITLKSVDIKLWPPNHQYMTIQLTDLVASATDSCNTSLNISNVFISKVTSDETENGNGDGNTLNDIVIAANCKSVQLRSERNGSGNGRVYTITFKVRDASGNVGTATAKVTVPKNSGGTAIDDGPIYTVTSGCQ